MRPAAIGNDYTRTQNSMTAACELPIGPSLQQLRPADGSPRACGHGRVAAPGTTSAGTDWYVMSCVKLFERRAKRLASRCRRSRSPLGAFSSRGLPRVCSDAVRVAGLALAADLAVGTEVAGDLEIARGEPFVQQHRAGTRVPARRELCPAAMPCVLDLKNVPEPQISCQARTRASLAPMRCLENVVRIRSCLTANRAQTVVLS